MSEGTGVFNLSSANVTDNFTLYSPEHRGDISIGAVSADTVTLLMGELNDSLALNSVTADDFYFQSPSGPNSSAHFTEMNLTGAWQIHGSEDGNGLRIDNLLFSAGGIVKGTSDEDSIIMRSNSSVGDRDTLIDLRDDNRQDNLLYET